MPTVPAQQPGGAPKELWWDQTRAAKELMGATCVTPHRLCTMAALQIQ
jgi:hypothetical protein